MRRPPSAGSTPAKNSSVDLAQDIEHLQLEAIHHYAIPHATFISLNDCNESGCGPHHAETTTSGYLNDRAASVFGGLQEVQMNVVAKAVLGLE